MEQIDPGFIYGQRREDTTMRAGVLGALMGAVLGMFVGLGSFYVTYKALAFWQIASHYYGATSRFDNEDLRVAEFAGYAFACVIARARIGGVLGTLLGIMKSLLQALSRIEQRLPPPSTPVTPSPGLR